MIHLGDIAADRSDMLARFQATFGQDHWVHHSNGWTLIGVNPASFDTRPGSAQAAWLRETLDACTGPIGLFLHQAWFKALGSDVARATRRSLEALFEGHDLRFVALGHTQVHEHHAEGVRSDWLPSIAFVDSDAEQEGDGQRLVGLARLTLDRAGHHFELLEVSGIQGFDPADYVVEFSEAPAPRARAYA